MRLIDADALIAKVDNSKQNNPHPQGMIRVNHRNEHDHFIKMIFDAPTVEAIVLPCKVGATVYRIYDDCDFPGDCGTKMMCKGCNYRNLFIEKQAFCLSMLSQNGKLENPYYLTRKDAETALARMKG